MAFPIRYSARARMEELEMLEYVVNKFGHSKGNEVYLRIEQVLALISEMPEMYPESKSRVGLRKCVFGKQTSIYYRVNDVFIEVISFRPNRKDPSKFKA